MIPTAYLRFVKRSNSQLIPTHLGTPPFVRVLQQWWTTSEYIPIAGNPDGCIGEWRDVPLENEE